MLTLTSIAGGGKMPVPTVIKGWIWNRVRETSTWVGAALIAAGHWGLSSTDPSVQQALGMFNNIAPQLGALLVGMSTKHP